MINTFSSMGVHKQLSGSGYSLSRCYLLTCSVMTLASGLQGLANLEDLRFVEYVYMRTHTIYVAH